jgi:hypothetical protein
MQTMRQVGGTVGLAIMGTVAATIQSNKLDDFAAQAGASPAQREQFERALSEVQGDPSAVAGLPPQTVSEAQDALVSGIQAAYYVGGAAVLAGAVLAWLLLRRVSAADAPGVPVPATPGAHPALRGAAEPLGPEQAEA